ncbi:MAG: hypothetical protein OSJ72_07850 [Lachnospiraceae bacterium]|nr:hypothetical protein [Lachnospiraceae bacterium]
MAIIQKNGLRQKKAGLRKADRNKAGRGITIVACILMLAITAAGCGKVEKPIPIDLSAGNMEELQGENAGGAEDDAINDATKEVEQDSAQGNSEQNAQSVGSTQLEGDVRSVEADSFVICKNETWEEDGYSYGICPAPGYEDESDLLTIHTTKDCDYQYKTVKNGGMNPEDVSTREGSFADVKEGLAVTIQGSWQEDGRFLADSVVLMEFV